MLMRISILLSRIRGTFMRSVDLNLLWKFKLRGYEGVLVILVVLSKIEAALDGP